MSCQVCRKHEASDKPARVCKVCGKRLCRFCFVVDRLGDVFCEEHKSSANHYNYSQGAP